MWRISHWNSGSLLPRWTVSKFARSLSKLFGASPVPVLVGGAGPVEPTARSCSPAMDSMRIVAWLPDDDGHGDAPEKEGLGLGLGLGLDRGQGALGSTGRRDQRRSQAQTPRSIQTAARYIRDLGGGRRRDPRGSLIVLVCVPVGKRLGDWPGWAPLQPAKPKP